ncbi:hypothetical protein G5I_07008 [Acromyrmex echinatior]|uniref:Uncharacterized protein n=1 Tax=Acromyrmex echinatior TaxID=103372 RepID=F4WMM5_ACREC|nr:hypothetical protein G5I_07008 [Acromyrmex echinatior]
MSTQHSQCKHLRVDARFREEIVHVRAAGNLKETRYVSSKAATWKCSHSCPKSKNSSSGDRKSYTFRNGEPLAPISSKPYDIILPGHYKEAHLMGVDLPRAQDTSRNNHRRGTMFILRILVEARSIKRPSCRKGNRHNRKNKVRKNLESSLSELSVEFHNGNIFLEIYYECYECFEAFFE